MVAFAPWVCVEQVWLCCQVGSNGITAKFPCPHTQLRLHHHPAAFCSRPRCAACPSPVLASYYGPSMFWLHAACCDASATCFPGQSAHPGFTRVKPACYPMQPPGPGPPPFPARNAQRLSKGGNVGMALQGLLALMLPSCVGRSVGKP